MPRHVCSHEMQVLLGLWDTSEKRETVNELLSHLHIDLLSNFAVNNELLLLITGDAKVLPYLTGSLGSNSNEPCVFCNLKTKRGRRENRRQFLETSWDTYLTRHSDRTIIDAPSPILTGMEIMGYTNFWEFITAPSLHALLSADSFIKIAVDPLRMRHDTNNQVFEYYFITIFIGFQGNYSIY